MFYIKGRGGTSISRRKSAHQGVICLISRRKSARKGVICQISRRKSARGGWFATFPAGNLPEGGQNRRTSFHRNRNIVEIIFR